MSPLPDFLSIPQLSPATGYKLTQFGDTLLLLSMSSVHMRA